MRFGLDSTDSVQGGCTTHVAAHVLHGLRPLVVRHAPRLVRLNPNVPYKTRGNGAIAFEVGRPVGPTRAIGNIKGQALLAADEVAPLSVREQMQAFDLVVETVHALRDPDSASAVVAFTSPPAPDDYWSAVQRHVQTPSAKPSFEQWWGNGRGRIGATAAAAWPGQRGTWEAIAYRDPARIRTRRDLDPDVGPRIDAAFPNTFDNWDARHRHLRIAPASPCPILAGVRSTDPAHAVGALSLLGPERPTDWVLFWTNQATGDHLRAAHLGDLRPFDSIRAQVTVDQDPTTRAGGHVLVPLRDPYGQAVALAYEPTKEFRDAVRSLRQGDRVEVEGAVHEDLHTIALEAFTLRSAAMVHEVTPPPCAQCGVSTKSVGRKGGYRCGRCGATYPLGLARRATQGRESFESRATVPVAVRRHLARPNQLDEARLIGPELSVIP